MRIAVLGAGLTGLFAAHTLANAGCSVTVYDKARAPGGRITTKHGPCGAFDIGAQYFTARSPAFQCQVDRWLEEQVIAPWSFVPHKFVAGSLSPSPDSTIRYVGIGGMSTITESLCSGLDLHCGHRASRISNQHNDWHIQWHNSGESEAFDWILLTLPLEQVYDLMAREWLQSFCLPASIHVPCHAVGIATEGKVAPEICGIFGDAQVSWVSRQSSKPGCSPPKQGTDSWMVHFSPAWTTRVGRSPGLDLATAANEWLSRATGTHLKLVASQTHYWAYANLDASVELRGPFVDRECGLAVAGAWCAGGRVEGAFTSANETCAAMLAA